MPKQNRVNPEGELIANSTRGALMGNRGCLHDDNQRIVRSSARDAWVTCLTSFKDRKRIVMQPGHYTELFFLDEATALAAGHRPCATCRRERYAVFLKAWNAANSNGNVVGVKDVDAQLKRERNAYARKEGTVLPALPTGAMFKHIPSGNFYLVRGKRAVQWTFEGYGVGVDLSSLSGPFIVLTPNSTLRAMLQGYEPDLHPSAL
ncbi:MAG: hypothetical protein KJ958_07050 [Gammaproteobacteria bacterium]|nr:hypothetical protein [Gammaproteobacteria bacterium]MBU1978908.1 hypothetical protein [Gammaproteobacteria bacterium]